jgi:uncharacterized protein involved in exopolysaccharide biosynthesis
VSTSALDTPSIDLGELVARIVAGRRILPLCAGAGVALAVAGWQLLPRTYVSEATRLPSTGDDASSMPGSLLSLAGTLGLSVPGGAVPESHLFPAILKSERVLRGVLQSPVDPGDLARGTLFERVADDRAAESVQMELAVETVRREILRVSLDEETGIVRVGVRMRDPFVAQRTADVLVTKLEEYLARERSARTRRSQEFVESRRTEAEAELRGAEKRLEQFRDANRRITNSPELMLAEGRLIRDVRVQEEVFLELTRQHEIAKIEAQKAMPIVEVLDPPTLRHAPESPRLPVLLGIGLLLGIMVGSVLAAVRDDARRALPALLSMFRLLGGRRA